MHDVLLCEGSLIEASEVRRSVIGVRSVIGKGSRILDSIILGNEFYERPPLETGGGTLHPHIGENCLISKAIIDENVTIGKNVRLTNEMGHVDYVSSDGLVHVKDGIMVIPRGAHIPDNYSF